MVQKVLQPSSSFGPPVLIIHCTLLTQKSSSRAKVMDAVSVERELSEFVKVLMLQRVLSLSCGSIFSMSRNEKGHHCHHCEI